MVKKIDPKESLMFNQLQELCALCAKGIVKISEDTGYSPKFVADNFLTIIQYAINKLEEN